MAQLKKSAAAKETIAQPRRVHPKPASEAVAQRAYEKFLARGGNHGNDLQDWLEAERELKDPTGRR